jgi:molecular chaperone GrpE
MAASDQQEPPVVIRDKRKIGREHEAGTVLGGESSPDTDPSGTDSAGAAASTAPAGPDAEQDIPKAQALLLDERTADLQRLQAEFANYRRRMDRDRVVSREQGVGDVLSSLLPVLDDIDRARAHGDLTGGLKSVADQLESALTKHGLQRFGEVGDPFDPTIHDAVMHDGSADVTEPTCTTVLRPGYRQGERLLRPAMVGVSDPLPGGSASTESADSADRPAAQTDPASAGPASSDSAAETSSD